MISAVTNNSIDKSKRKKLLDLGIPQEIGINPFEHPDKDLDHSHQIPY